MGGLFVLIVIDSTESQSYVSELLTAWGGELLYNLLQWEGVHPTVLEALTPLGPHLQLPLSRPDGMRRQLSTVLSSHLTLPRLLNGFKLVSLDTFFVALRPCKIYLFTQNRLAGHIVYELFIS